MPGRLRVVILALALLGGGPAAPAEAETDFDGFVAALWPDAAAAGVRRETFDRAFAGLSPDPKVIALARTQPEFNQSFAGYVANRVTAARVAQGRRLAAQWKPWLDRIERDTGVDRNVVLAIWAMESNFGTGSGTSDVVRSLATLACCTTRRPDYFRGELIDALKILEAHDIEPRTMTGSWAGAMGQTQFMPSSFLEHAVDEDHDGRRDIWKSTPDALGSIAYYLQQQGWERGAPWAYEVRLPPGFDFGAITAHEGRPVADWLTLGVAPAGGRAPADPGAKAWLLLPTGAKGPAFLTLQNYWTIKLYNVSDSYTVSVGYLADRIGGAAGLATPWPSDKPLPRDRIEAMQKRLVAAGFPIDKVDGKVGPSTRRALRGWQTANGLLADGYATAGVLDRMGVP